MHRIPAVAEEIALLRRRNDECVHLVAGEQRTDRVHTGGPGDVDGAEEPQADTELIQESPARPREIRASTPELPPGGHAPTLPNAKFRVNVGLRTPRAGP